MEKVTVTVSEAVMKDIWEYFPNCAACGVYMREGETSWDDESTDSYCPDCLAELLAKRAKVETL